MIRPSSTPGKGTYRAPSRSPRRISRADMHAHYRGDALAMCRAFMVDAEVQLAAARGRYFNSPVAKRRAASKCIRALGFMVTSGERDVDAVAFELFDRDPYPRPAVWDEEIAEQETRRGGG